MRTTTRIALALTATVTAAAAVLTNVGAADAHTVSTVNPNATATTKQVLNWLAHLPNRSSNRVASGFFGGYSNNGFSLSQTEEMHSATGQYPTFLACDYGAGWATSSDITSLIDYSCNSTLQSWWNSGGLVTIDVHSPSPANADGGGLNTHMSNFSDLLNTGTAAGARWRSLEDKMAAGLAQLRDAGVTVVWRPFHEVNGDWFWWGNQDPTTFKQVWQQMYDYFTNTKGLNNLIWEYSADFSRGNVTAYYNAPYVDMVGLDAYDDNPQNSGIVSAYNQLVGLGKPFAFSEIGPDTTGSFDFGQWATAFHNAYPKTSYFLNWNDSWSPARNQGAWTLYNDSWVLNRGEVDLTNIVESGGGTTTTTPPSGTSLLAGFESGTEGWTGVNVTGGPWQVNEWASQGSYSLKSDVSLYGGNQIYLARVAGRDLSGYSTLRATARVAPWGNHATGTQAKLYIKVGSSWQWYDGGTVTISSSGTNLSLNIGGISGRNDVREIGVQFLPASGSSGGSAVYVDNVTAQ